MGSISLPKAWKSFLKDPEKEPWWNELTQWYLTEIATQEVYPPREHLFEALKRVEPDKVQVVILGQDPYHGPGQAHGLSFSVPAGIKAPPSLANIQKELRRSFGEERPGAVVPSDLTGWANQGVLLLNTVLSVRSGAAFSHRGRGWEILSQRILSALGKNTRGKVFMLWGNPARVFRPLVAGPQHLVLESSHPSPLSAHRGFLGCDHFRLANVWLEKQGRAPIDWFAGEGLF